MSTSRPRWARLVPAHIIASGAVLVGRKKAVATAVRDLSGAGRGLAGC